MVASQDREIVKAALAHFDVEKQTSGDTMKELADIDNNQELTNQTIELLLTGKGGVYEKAIVRLKGEMKRRWIEVSTPQNMQFLDLREIPARYADDANGLLEFLQDERIRYENRRQELQNRPLIREQLIGDAFDPAHLDGIARYEVHLDRKLERMLTMLLKLQDLRRGGPADVS